MTRPIFEVLSQLRDGKALEEASDLLAEVVRAVHKTRKPGTLTIALRIAHSKGKPLLVSDVVTAKVPQKDTDASLFFATKDGGLTRDDPDQRELPFRSARPEPDTLEQEKDHVG